MSEHLGMGRGTLARQLVLRVAALVMLLALLLGVASTLAVRHQLMSNLDGKLADAVVRTQRFGGNGRGGMDDRPPPGTDVDQITVVRSVSGTGGVVWIEGGKEQLATGIVNHLLTVESDRPRTVHIEELHQDYRVLSSTHDGTTRIVALPTDEVDHSLRQLIMVELILLGAALVAAVVLAQALVRNALRPLNRLAATATEVSRLELDRGEVALPMRVPGTDADPANEVGRVGHAFNHMLNNVEGALATRQQSETKVRQFVADASHELRNPLAAIRGYAELTRRGRDELPEDAQFAMGRIEAESERMSKLVEDMLLLARLDNDPGNLNLAPVDVVEVVLNATSDAQVSWPGKSWSLDLPEAAIVARADAQKLHQVVVNLLANANKHTPDGTSVRASVRAEGDWAVVRVADNGPGIDPRVKGQVFERFARADVARAHSAEASTGLGLAIVAAVMQAHGGTASVESVPGRTEFTLRVPLAR